MENIISSLIVALIPVLLNNTYMRKKYKKEMKPGIYYKKKRGNVDLYILSTFILIFLIISKYKYNMNISIFWFYLCMILYIFVTFNLINIRKTKNKFFIHFKNEGNAKLVYTAVVILFIGTSFNISIEKYMILHLETLAFTYISAFVMIGFLWIYLNMGYLIIEKNEIVPLNYEVIYKEDKRLLRVDKVIEEKDRYVFIRNKSSINELEIHIINKLFVEEIIIKGKSNNGECE
jgi:rRNA processing protein Gar1